MQGLGQGVSGGVTLTTTSEVTLNFGTQFGLAQGGNVTLGGDGWGQEGGQVPLTPTVWVIASIPITPGTGTTSVTVRLYTQNSVRDSVVIANLAAGVATTVTVLMRDTSGALSTVPASTGTPGGAVNLSVQQAGATANGSTGTAEMCCFTF